MSAAYYLARLGYPVTVYEAMPVPGGMMAIGIPEYRLPREVLRAEIDRIVGLGVKLEVDRAMGRDFSLAVKEKMLFAGFVALMALMVTVIYNDLTRIAWIERLMPWR